MDINRIVNEAFDKAFYEPPVPKKIETVVSAPQIKNQPVEKKEEKVVSAPPVKSQPIEKKEEPPKPNTAPNVQKEDVKLEPTPIPSVRKNEVKPAESSPPTIRKEEAPQKVVDENAVKNEQDDNVSDFYRRMLAATRR